MKKTIRKFEENDWDKLWPILESVFRAGETYPFPTDITKEEVHQAGIAESRFTVRGMNEFFCFILGKTKSPSIPL